MTRWFGCLAIVTLLIGCTPGEGERCNPMLFNDECPQDKGLMCVYPKNCPVAYCCPAKITPNTASTCQPCPAPDGGQ